MPLAMGFISEEGVKGASMRYLKQYLAVWLQSLRSAYVLHYLERYR